MFLRRLFTLSLSYSHFLTFSLTLILLINFSLILLLNRSLTISLTLYLTHYLPHSLSNSLTNSHAGGVARRAVTPYGNDTIIWPGSEPPPEPAESWRKVKDPRRSDGTSMWVGVATNEVG